MTEPTEDATARRKAWVAAMAAVLIQAGVRKAGARGVAGDISNGKWTLANVGSAMEMLESLPLNGEW